MRITLAAAALLLYGSAASAQGYFDFDSVPGLGEQPQVQIDLNGQMLGFVKAIAQESDPETASILAGIEGVRVRVYGEVEDRDELLGFIDDTSGRLERDGWQRAVYVQDKEDRVRIYVRFEDERMAGMTVMVATTDSDEGAVFINVVGEIDPAQLGRLARNVGVGGVLDDTFGSGQDD